MIDNLDNPFDQLNEDQDVSMLLGEDDDMSSLLLEMEVKWKGLTIEQAAEEYTRLDGELTLLKVALADRKRAVQAQNLQIEFLKSRISEMFEALGIEKFTRDTSNGIMVVKTTKSTTVDLVDEDLVPADKNLFSLERKYDLAAIRKQIAKGVETGFQILTKKAVKIDVKRDKNPINGDY